MTTRDLVLDLDGGPNGGLAMLTWGTEQAATTWSLPPTVALLDRPQAVGLGDAGSHLFDAVFTADVWRLFDKAVAMSKGLTGMRLWIRCDRAELAELPWELLLIGDSPVSPQGSLIASGASIIRSINLLTASLRDGSAQPPPAPTGKRLQLLLVSDSKDQRSAQLRADIERYATHAAGVSVVEFDPKALREAVTDIAPQVVHISAPARRDGPEFESLLRLLTSLPSPRPQLVALNNLPTGEPRTQPSLLTDGFNACISAPASMIPEDERAFYVALYEALGDGLPIDEGVLRGRATRSPSGDPSSWARPQLWAGVQADLSAVASAGVGQTSADPAPHLIKTAIAKPKPAKSTNKASAAPAPKKTTAKPATKKATKKLAKPEPLAEAMAEAMTEAPATIDDVPDLVVDVRAQ